MRITIMYKKLLSLKTLCGTFKCLLGITLLSLTGCWPGRSPEVTTQNPLMVINVLSPEYHEDAHITGSLNSPLDKLSRDAQHWSKAAEIVLYCANYQCLSSHEAVHLLKSQGFSNVVAYEGGTAEWLQKGYPITGKAERAYLHQNVEKPEQKLLQPTEIITAEELKSRMEQAKKEGRLSVKNV